MDINKMIRMFKGLVDCEETEELKLEISTFEENDPMYKILEEISILGFIAQGLITDMENLRDNDLLDTEYNTEESIKYDAQEIINFLKNPQEYLS